MEQKKISKFFFYWHIFICLYLIALDLAALLLANPTFQGKILPETVSKEPLAMGTYGMSPTKCWKQEADKGFF